MNIKSIQNLVSDAMAEIKTINADEAYQKFENNNCNLIDIREINELDNYDDRKMCLEDLGLSESGSSRLIKETHNLLNLSTFYTAGKKEVRAWTFKKGSKAPQVAGIIHTDFEKGFIKADVIKYNDYINFGSELKVKEAGKLKTEGKEYVVIDGDIINFKFNT